MDRANRPRTASGSKWISRPLCAAISLSARSNDIDATLICCVCATAGAAHNAIARALVPSDQDLIAQRRCFILPPFLLTQASGKRLPLGHGCAAVRNELLVSIAVDASGGDQADAPSGRFRTLREAAASLYPRLRASAFPASKQRCNRSYIFANQ
jgi:hypothetical protein